MNEFVLAIALTVLWSVWTSCRPEEKRYPKRVYSQENAVWTESIYLRGFRPSTQEKLTDQHLLNYANVLKENNVKYAYLFAGPYQEDGHLPSYALSDTAVSSIKQIKKYYPAIVILPWVGGVQNKTVYLEDSIWVNNAIADTKKLVQTLDVPGVHVDFEYILPGDPYLDTTINPEKPGDRASYGDNVNHFHRLLRDQLPDAFISSVVVATPPGTQPWKRKTSMDELRVLTRYIDQLSFLYYDTGIGNQKAFSENCKRLLEDIRQLDQLSMDHSAQYLIAIGTFVNRTELRKYRNLTVESIPNTLRTIKDNVLQVAPSEPLVDGIAIFCDWHTEETEWQQFYEHWGGQ